MKNVQFLLVGVLFFIAMGVVAYFTIITEGGPLKKELHSMSILFPNSEGLKTGSKVTVQGVPYGYVSKVQLVQVDIRGEIIDPSESENEVVGTKVEVVIVLQQPLRLRENYKIKIRNESLLSGRVIAIDPGDSKTDLLQSSKKKSTRIEGGTSDDPLVSLSELIAENRADIRKTMSNIAELTSKINNGQGTLGKLINNDEIHSNVNTTLTDAQIVLRELREGLEDTREQAPVTSFIRAALTAF
jgi:phospholipid/cholesterol/gamma-HCH transport system substrate-binding protein